MRSRTKDLSLHFKLTRSTPSDIKLKEIVDQLEAYFIESKLHLEGHILGNGQATFYFKDTEANIRNFISSMVQHRGYTEDCFSIEAELESGQLAIGSKGRRAKIFDVWAVPLTDGTFGYFQILDRFVDRGHVIQVFDLKTAHPVGVDVLTQAPLLFPPVFTLIIPKVINECNLKFISNWKSPVPNFVFRHTQLTFPCAENYDKPDWYIWSKATGSTFVGKLSEEYRDIEPRWSWPLAFIVKRIERRIMTRDIDEYLESGGFAK